MNGYLSHLAHTNDAVLQLRLLNAKFIEAEIRARKLYQHLLEHVREFVLDKAMDDYNITCQLCLFSKNEHCNKRHHVEEGDSFYESKFLLPFEVDSEHDYNWNEFAHMKGSDHPLAEEVYCYTMSRLLFHADNLTWDDICAIDKMWIELKVDYQLFIKPD